MSDRFWLCTNCGAQNEAGRTACAVCALPAQQAAKAAAPATPDAPDKSEVPPVDPIPPKPREKTLSWPLVLITLAAFGLFAWRWISQCPVAWADVPQAIADNAVAVWDFIRQGAEQCVARLRELAPNGFVNMALNAWYDLQDVFAGQPIMGGFYVPGLILSLLWLVRVCHRKRVCLRRGRGSVVPLIFEMPVVILLFAFMQGYWQMDPDLGYAFWCRALSAFFFTASIAVLLALLILIVWGFFRRSSARRAEIFLLILAFLIQISAAYGLY